MFQMPKSFIKECLFLENFKRGKFVLFAAYKAVIEGWKRIRENLFQTAVLCGPITHRVAVYLAQSECFICLKI